MPLFIFYYLYYNQIIEIIEKLTKLLTANMDKDFSKIIHMTGVYVKIFLCENNSNNHDFHADFNYIENL